MSRRPSVRIRAFPNSDARRPRRASWTYLVEIEGSDPEPELDEPAAILAIVGTGRTPTHATNLLADARRDFHDGYP